MSEIENTETNEKTQEAAAPEPASREAAKYRRQLRDTEAERDQLRSTIDAMRRRFTATTGSSNK